MKLICGILQAILAIAKCVVFVILPVISITIPIVAIPILNTSGMTLIRLNSPIAFVTLAVYCVLLIFSVGPLTKYGIVPAIIALVVEILTIILAGSIMQSGDISAILALIPPEYQQYQQYLNAGLTHLSKPGLGLLINILLTVLYSAASLGSIFLPSDSLHGSGSNNRGSRSNAPNITGNTNSSSINRSRPRL